jgi:threonyl-tRNA synthetase
MNAKIRDAQNFQVPYMLVIGDQEIENNTVSLRKRDGSRVNGMAFSEFVDLLAERDKSRSSDL